MSPLYFNPFPNMDRYIYLEKELEDAHQTTEGGYLWEQSEQRGMSITCCSEHLCSIWIFCNRNYLGYKDCKILNEWTWYPAIQDDVWEVLKELG